MAVLGIVLIVLAVLLGLGVAVASSDSTTMSVYGVDFGVIVPTVFFLGAAVGAALMFGLWLTKKGLGRGYRRRKEMKELRQQAAVGTTPETAAGEPATASRADREPDRELDTGAGPTSDSTTEPIDTTQPSGGTTGRHAASTGDHLTDNGRTVADGTETRQPH